jgi:NADPH:quinone reductase-like Zn-dependent oxidoreductase
MNGYNWCNTFALKLNRQKMNANPMQAVVYKKYGPPEVLHLQQMPTPQPKPNEVLIKIHATTVTSGDWRLRKADPLFARVFTGLFAPKNPILGHELAGKVEAVGIAVTQFKQGDKVFGSTGMQTGTYAEYICLPETSALAPLPHNLTFEEAAAIPVGAQTALHFLREAKISPGETVLIYGASGSVGTYAVQLAKHFGATVTAVCSAANMEMVKALGADIVIDYQKTDFAQAGQTYDVVFDAVERLQYAQCRQVLKPKGRYVTVSWGLGLTATLLWNKVTGRHPIILGMSVDNAVDLYTLKSLAESGAIKPVIDRRYPLTELPEAHRYTETWRKKGNVVIQVGA